MWLTALWQWYVYDKVLRSYFENEKTNACSQWAGVKGRGGKNEVYFIFILNSNNYANMLLISQHAKIKE